MIAGLLIIIIFPFIYFYTQMNKFNQKTDIIRTAINEGKEIYIDPLTGKMHWTENGEQVVLTSILSVGNKIQGCIPGDKVLQGVKTGRVYKNFSYKDFEAHVKKQLNNKEIWCAERKHYRDGGWYNDSGMKYHMQDKYLYCLESKIKWVTHVKQHPNDTGYKDGIAYYYKRLFNQATNNYYQNRIEITYDEYIKLGGRNRQPEFIIQHMK